MSKRPQVCLSINEASRVLRARGLTPRSRHALELAIARRELNATVVTERLSLIHSLEFERWAAKACSRDPRLT